MKLQLGYATTNPSCKEALKQKDTEPRWRGFTTRVEQFFNALHHISVVENAFASRRSIRMRKSNNILE